MKKWIFGIITAVFVLILTTALCLGFFHVNDSLYIRDMEKYDIQQYTGMDKEEILVNYRAVMSYLSPFSHEEFKLPTMKFSQNGAYHFYETKMIFKNVYILGVASAIAVAALAINIKRLKRGTLLISSALTFALPVMVLSFVFINFDKAFIMFHKIFFDNTMWIFEPAQDPIINILPAEYFMHCGIAIGICWISASLIQLGLHFVLNKEVRRG